MGCTFEQGKDYPRIGTPVHEVRLTQDYWLGKYEVTQAQWEKVMGKNPSYANPCPKCPVEHVFWKDVEEFLSRLNAELKKNNPQARAFYRLPAEAKWEHAARGEAKAVATRYAGPPHGRRGALVCPKLRETLAPRWR